MRFLILGPMAIDAERESPPLGGRKQRLVLAHLLRRPNRWVSVDRLIDDVWGDEPPDAAKTSLQAYVSHLRKVVGAQRLETGPGGYRLVIGEGELDAVDFERAVADTASVLGTDPDSAATSLRDALALWRGPAFADLADEPSLAGEIGRLEEAHLGATEQRIEADLACGRHTALIGELDGLTRDWPLREHFWGQKMLALYRAERPAEALATYRAARAILVDELGVEPGRTLQHLHERILLQDPDLDAPTRDDDVTATPDNPYKGLRPFREGDEQDFHGRDDLIEQLVVTLDRRAPLVTLIGPSGSGKSSAVSAGLIPALRKGRARGRWEICSMRPGAHPFTEFDASLSRSFPSWTGRAGASDRDTWLLEASLPVLPDDGSTLLLVIDQFEELFTLVDDGVRNRFLAGLVTAAAEPGDPLQVLVVLRADFFDRPLAYPVFGRIMTEHIVHVLPLGPSELEAAAAKPAQRVGVGFERGLLAELIGDVSRPAERAAAVPVRAHRAVRSARRRRAHPHRVRRARWAPGRGGEPSRGHVHRARRRAPGSRAAAVPAARQGGDGHRHAASRASRRARVARHRHLGHAGSRGGVRLEPPRSRWIGTPAPAPPRSRSPTRHC